MSKINDLIAKHCPNGVEFKQLGQLGFLYGGLTGKNKNDFQNGNAKYITYMNIYSNIEVNFDCNDYVSIGENENQNKIEIGDVLFTGSSETPDECGFSSVLTEVVQEPLYLNSFSFGYRLNDKKIFLPHFLKYLFRSNELRKQIAQTASGVTRYNVSKKRFAKINIPIPPIVVQEEIVNILDAFTTLETELETELENRKRQFSYYKDWFLSFEGEEVEWKTLGEVGQFVRGNGLQKKDFVENGVGCIHYGQIYTHYGTSATKTKSFVSNDLSKKLKKASKNDLIIAGVSENVADVCKSVVWLGDEDICISGDSYIFKHKQNPTYIAYLFQTNRFLEYKKKNAQGAKVTRLKSGSLPKFPIPVPSLETQEQIANILGKMDSLVNDINVGLPAEIKARNKQYEYYRNQLFAFKQLNNE